MASSCFNLASSSAALAFCSAVGAPHCSPNNLQFIAVDAHPPKAKASAASAKIGAVFSGRTPINHLATALGLRSAVRFRMGHQKPAIEFELVRPQKGAGIPRAFGF
jgi:hypothetical protein